MKATNLSKQKREKMLNTLNEIKKKITDDSVLQDITLIENELNNKKYGLIWEEHQERVDVELQTQIPVFENVEDKKIYNDKNNHYNFLLEGDNLHSLYLLEKTHKGKIDVIYIDPPYNTGEGDFIYNDKLLDKNDEYKHSKWLSFMKKRIDISKKLLSEKGVIFISIDDNEQAQLKLMCDEIFGSHNFESFIWQKKGGSGNTEKIIGCLTEYILCYFKNKKAGIFNYREIQREYKYKDEKGKYNLEGLEKTNLGIYNRPTMLFEIIDKKTGISFFPRNNNRWTIGKNTAEDYQNNQKLFFNYKNNRVYRKKYAEDYKASKNVYYNLFLDMGSLSTAKDEMARIFKKENREIFSTPKPIELITHIFKIATKKDATVLDFFAGSGTTAQAVLELNKKDGGNRQFILCTNNENNICEDITYQRIKTVITGKRKDESIYSEGIPANLKYFKTSYVPRINTEEENLHTNLLINIKNLIELENRIDIDDKKIRVYLNEKELDSFTSNDKDLKECEIIYISSDVLLSQVQEQKFRDNNIKVFIIPEYYFKDEIMEVL